MYKARKNNMGRRVASAALCLSMMASAMPMASAAMNEGVKDQGTATTTQASDYLEITTMEVRDHRIKLTINATKVSDGNQFFAVVMPTSEFAKTGGLTSINTTNYIKASNFGVGVDDKNWRTAEPFGDNGVHTIAFDLLIPPTPNLDTNSYHEQYNVVVMCSKGTKIGVSDYATATFYLDSEGNSNSRDNSYMVYHKAGEATANKGNSQAVVETAYQITQRGLDTTLDFNTAKVYRNGYAFLGWDADGTKLDGVEPNEAAKSDAVNTATYKTAEDLFLNATATENNKINVLYPLWKPLQVDALEEGGTDEAVFEKKDDNTVKIGGLQVNEEMNWQYLIKSDPRTTKTVSVSEADQKFLSDVGINLATSIRSTKAGYAAVAEEGYVTLLSGKPKAVNDAPKEITLTITDDANKTTDTFKITIPVIKAGKQGSPWTDWNTGLEGKGVTKNTETNELNKDGQVLGFYPTSAGTGDLPGDNPVMTDRTYEISYNADPAVAFPEDETEMGKNGWTTWRTLNKDGLLAGGATEDALAGIKAVDKRITSEDSDLHALSSVVLEDLPAGRYAIRFAEIKDKFGASEIVNIVLGEGSGSTSDQPGMVVYFDLDGGAMPAEMDPADKDFKQLNVGLAEKDKVALPRTVPTREGYTFLGWDVGAKDKDGNVVLKKYPDPVQPAAEAEGDTSADDTIYVTLEDKSVIAKAVWKQSYTVTLDLAGGVVSNATVDNSDANKKLYPDLVEQNEANFAAAIEAGKGLADKAEFAIPYVLPSREGYTFLGWSDGDATRNAAKTYYNNQKIETSTTEANAKVAIAAKDVTLTAIWGAGTEAYGAVSYYDWDGTLLGSSIVSRVSTGADLENTMKAFAATQMDEGASDANHGYVANAAKPLSNKNGYRFENVWILNSSDAFECYYDPDTTYNDPTSITGTHSTKADLLASNHAATGEKIMAILSAPGSLGAVEVRACYGAQETLNAGGDSYYTITNERFDRYGNAGLGGGNYSIKLEALRQNANHAPVARLKEPAVMAVYQTPKNANGSTPVAYNLAVLDATDVASAELVPDGEFEQVTYRVIDLSDGDAWALNVSRSSTTQVNNTVNGTVGTPGFIRDGSAGILYTAGMKAVVDKDTADWTKYCQMTTFTNGGFKYNGGKLNARLLNSTYKPNILKALEEAVAHGYTQPFTWAQMQKAIDTGVVYTENGETPMPWPAG